jgi:hypothetical protein
MNTTHPGEINITAAEYLSGYVLRVRFDDGTVREIDFAPFLCKSQHPDIKKYRRLSGFKRFKIEGGNLMWGDYEMIFPVIDLYRGSI